MAAMGRPQAPDNEESSEIRQGSAGVARSHYSCAEPVSEETTGSRSYGASPVYLPALASVGLYIVISFRL